MGNRAEQFRRGTIDSGDPLLMPSGNQRSKKGMKEAWEKHFHLKGKVANAERRRALQEEQFTQYMQSIFYWSLNDMLEGSATTQGIKYVSEHAEDFGRVTGKFTTEKGTKITIIEFPRAVHEKI